jgi:Na+/H+ antiporter NhaD/arsenite permease-like protein
VTIPFEFILFGATLLGIALFHRHTLPIALGGLAAITAYKLGFGDFHGMPGWYGLQWHLEEEWVTLANLFALLVGFAVLSRHFEDSGLPQLLPRVLPDDWKGGFVLLALVFVLSAFLDNIAAAMIGATVAGAVYRHRVQIGFLAAIVGAANAGGAGSVVGDTTTTMMWLDGVSPCWMGCHPGRCCMRTWRRWPPSWCSPSPRRASSSASRPSNGTLPPACR